MIIYTKASSTWPRPLAWCTSIKAGRRLVELDDFCHLVHNIVGPSVCDIYILFQLMAAIVLSCILDGHIVNQNCFKPMQLFAAV